MSNCLNKVFAHAMMEQMENDLMDDEMALSIDDVSGDFEDDKPEPGVQAIHGFKLSETLGKEQGFLSNTFKNNGGI